MISNLLFICFTALVLSGMAAIGIRHAARPVAAAQARPSLRTKR